MLIKEHSSYKNKSKQLLRPLAIAIAASFASMNPTITQAQNFTVSTTANGGSGSLREALSLADGNPGADTINFSSSITPGSTILIFNELLINSSVTISGPIAGDPNSIVIDAYGYTRVLNANTLGSADSLTLENMTITRGNAGANTFHSGGGILIGDGNVTLNHLFISNNNAFYFNATAGSIDATSGAGILSLGGNLVINHSIIAGNSATDTGGGISFQSLGSLIINHSTISKNHANGHENGAGLGAGITVLGGDLTMNSSTVTDNLSQGSGSTSGGLHLYGGSTEAIINNSTISNNSASDSAGILSDGATLTLNQSTVSGNIKTIPLPGAAGISQSGGVLTINQSTIVNNSSPSTGGIHGLNTVITLSNSILSGNTGTTNGNFLGEGGTTLTVNKSMFGDTLTEITTNNFAYPSNTHALGILQHNGGTTKTHKPYGHSEVINRGDNIISAAFNVDQRSSIGFQRIKGNNVDMGALEVQNISGNTVLALKPNEVLTRRDMAREFLKVIEGNALPAAISSAPFDDVQVGDINADWIKKFKDAGYTQGCNISGSKFCPNAIVTREEMAKVFLQVLNDNPTHIPLPSSTSSFSDVLLSDKNGEWVSELHDLGFTEGCATGKFCPKEPVTRKWFDALLGELL